ncbi:uncharacterized protein [Apostichopus japonicus]|uniref:uncharacterized protein n=1 Tax=Stichopus japonicus TaxID=307972 RepID=UPI003AB874DD
MNKDTNPTNAFPSGFDRWMTLQLTSQRITRRAAILNALEELKLSELCKQIDATLQIENCKREVVCEKLQDNLKENRLYWGALHRMLANSLETETAQRPVTSEMLPYGRYHGRSFANMADNVQRQREYVRQMRMKHVTDLLKLSKKESSVLIDRGIPTDDLLGNTDKPLSQRLQRTKSAKFKSIKIKANAVAKFIEIGDTVKEKHQRKLKNTSFVFKTDVEDDL